MIVEYSSNNSGGSWWLKDTDWKALEEAGWDVLWGDATYCRSDYRTHTPSICESKEECHGHREFKTYNEITSAEKKRRDVRWLGALAREARKEFPTLREAIEEWERITHQTASDEGCNCCGPPHSFSGGRDYASGENVLERLYADVSTRSLSKRELLEALKPKPALEEPSGRKIVLSKKKKKKKK